MYPTIVIDPGHPTKVGDQGVKCKGFVESEWAMDISLRLKDVLFAHGFTVELTREDQQPLSLTARGAISVKYQADLVISLHANANQDERVDGMMCFVKVGQRRVADIGNRILRTYNQRGHYVSPEGKVLERKPSTIECSADHRYWGRAFNVLKHHVAPALLVEAGFATNRGDRIKMQSETGKALICAAIADGVAYWAHYYPARGVI